MAGRQRRGSGSNTGASNPAPSPERAVAAGVEPGAQGQGHSAPDEDFEDVVPATAAADLEYSNMPAYARPGPRAADASPKAERPLPAPSQQSFAGKYTALARLNLDDGNFVQAGTDVTLDDATARHFLKHKVIRLAGRKKARVVTAADLGQDQNFAGEYIANVRLKLDTGDVVAPGETVQFDDATARHFLLQQAIRSTTGLEL